MCRIQERSKIFFKKCLITLAPHRRPKFQECAGAWPRPIKPCSAVLSVLRRKRSLNLTKWQQPLQLLQPQTPTPATGTATTPPLKITLHTADLVSVFSAFLFSPEWICAGVDFFLKSEDWPKAHTQKWLYFKKEKTHQGNVWTWQLSYKHLFISSRMKFSWMYLASKIVLTLLGILAQSKGNEQTQQLCQTQCYEHWMYWGAERRVISHLTVTGKFYCHIKFSMKLCSDIGGKYEKDYSCLDQGLHREGLSVIADLS